MTKLHDEILIDFVENKKAPIQIARERGISRQRISQILAKELLPAQIKEIILSNHRYQRELNPKPQKPNSKCRKCGEDTGSSVAKFCPFHRQLQVIASRKYNYDTREERRRASQRVYYERNKEKILHYNRVYSKLYQKREYVKQKNRESSKRQYLQIKSNSIKYANLLKYYRDKSREKYWENKNV